MAKFILKDWYGNNCEFDHDKIFVQDAHGELIPFTQGEKPVFEELNVTDNGRYTPREGVDGFNVVSVDVPAPEIKLQTKTITENGTYHADPSYDGLGSVEVNVKDEGNVFLLSNFEVTGFAEDSKYGAYSKDLTFGTDLDSFGLSIGREYSVGWGDELYTVYAKDTGYIVDEVIEEYGELVTIYHSVFYLGNGALLGIDRLEDSGEPFVILWTQSKGLTIVTTSTAESHVLGLIKRSRPQEIVDMLLESKTVTENGTYTADPFYDGLKQVTVAVPIPEVVLQDKTITENGTFTADEGFDGLGSVTVDVKGGGGSLQPGGYWKHLPQIPLYYGRSVVNRNGTIYFLKMSSSTDTKFDVCLLENDTCTQIATDVSSNNFPSKVEYKGHFHMYGEYGNHIMFDEEWKQTTLTSHSDGSCFHSMFVIDDTLYKKEKSSFYKWIEDSDTWESVAVANCPTTNNHKVIVYGRNLYVIGQGSIYKVDWDAKTCTLIRNDIPSHYANETNTCLVGEYIYFMTYTDLYKYNIKTDEYEWVSSVAHNPMEMYVYNGRIRLTDPIKSSYGVHLELYEVTE